MISFPAILRFLCLTLLFISHVKGQAPLTFDLLDSIKTMSGPSWDRDNVHLYVSSHGRLWRTSSQSGVSDPVLADSGFTGIPRLAQNGRSIAAVHGDQLWMISPSTGAVIAKVSGEIDSHWDLSSSGRSVQFAGSGYLWSRVSKHGRHARIKKSPEMFGLNQLVIDGKVVSEERGIVWIFSPYGSPVEWSPDGDRLYFLSARTGWSKIWSIMADGSDLRQETFGESDDRDFQVLADHSVLFVSNRRRNVEWSLWHQKRGNEPLFLFGDWGTVQSPAASPDGKKVAFLFSTPTQPSELYVLDRVSGDTRKISNNAPRSLSSRVVQGHIFSYPSSLRVIEGIIYVPRGVDSVFRAPAVVRLHGGPSMHDGLSWSSTHQYIASRGYVVLAVNYTGSVGYGREFEESDLYRIGYEDCDDVAAAARALKLLPFVRADRIGVCGASYGGYLTNLVIGRYPRLFTAGVSWYGITNWFTNDSFPHLHPVVKYFFRDRMGDPITQEALYRFASPITYADSVRTPLLLAHGDVDTVVPPNQSEEFYKVLQSRGSKVSLTIYNGEGHGWSRRETRLDAYGQMEQWFNKYLRDQE